jgi:hypothetical protein
MTPALKTAYAVIGLVVGIAGLSIDAWVIFPPLLAQGRGPLDVFVYYWTYFTHLTNLGLVLVYLAALVPWRGLGWFRRPQTQALMAGFITLVMLFYHFMLAPYYEMEGALQVATILLHYVTPLLYLGWWALCAPHGTAKFRDLPVILLPGVVYVAWVLIRGLWAHEYPYDILNPDKLGYGGVAIGVGIIFVAVSLFCLVLIWLDGLLARTRRQ